MAEEIGNTGAEAPDNQNEGPSLREALESAYVEESEKAEAPPSEQAPVETQAATEKPTRAEGRARRPDGTFAPHKATEASAPSGEKAAQVDPAAAVAAGAAQQPPAPAAVEAPKSWTPEARQLFEKADPALRQYIAQREDQMHRGVQQLHARFGQKAQIADEFIEAQRPYEAIIRAEGGTPIAAFKELLNAAYVVRRGTPEQKVALVLNTCRDFGIDLNKVIASANEQPQPQSQPSFDPNAIRQIIEAEFTQRDNQARVASATDIITSFGAEKDGQGQPLRPHFEAIRKDMVPIVASLRQANPSMAKAEVLQQAYDRAVWANPDTRAKLLHAQEEKRQAEARNKAAQAAKAAVSVTGAPGVSASAAANSKKSIRSAITDAFNEHEAGRV
ncbi:MAG: hypothetical protein NUW01_07160 [Gemmatimonadaceae bacterium]|nr:hypothetical protein [Gemmatimonadaceae bacterium]